MIGTGGRVAICDEIGKPATRDKTQVRDSMQSWRADRLVRQIHSSEGDREGIRVVQFDEIVWRKSLPRSLPFVDLQIRGIAERLRHIGHAKTRLAQNPLSVIE